MLELEQAVERILTAMPTLKSETVTLAAAVNRIIAETVRAPVDLPGFDNSAMDGYAVRANDVATAVEDRPVTLKIVGHIPAGECFPGEVQAGECVRLFTGSPLPRGTDSVVMQEDTTRIENESARIRITSAVRSWENVRLRGEDVKRGTVLLEKGEAVRLGALGILAATGISRLVVTRRPLLALLATGDELQEADRPLSPGKIFESNRIALGPLLERMGAIPKVYPIVADNPTDTQAALERAFSECDGVVTTGGVSVGEHDWVKTAFEAAGGEIHFWQVAMRPGKPFVFGQRAGKLLFGLPGNPVSALVTAMVLVAPALRRWQAANEIGWPSSLGTLREPLENLGDRRHFMRVRVDSEGGVWSAGIQASHILSGLVRANGLVDVRPRTRIEAGAAIRILRWDTI